MDPHDVLIADQIVLRGILDETVDATPAAAARRRALRGRPIEVLTIHAQIEDQLYYRRIRDLTSLFAIVHAEHRQLDDQLSVLLCSGPASADFASDAHMFAAALGHHAAKEETQMFPQVERVLSAAELDRIRRNPHEFQQRLNRSPVTRTRIRVKHEILSRLPWRPGLPLFGADPPCLRHQPPAAR